MNQFLLGCVPDLRKLKAEGHEFVTVEVGETRRRISVDDLLSEIECVEAELRQVLRTEADRDHADPGWGIVR